MKAAFHDAYLYLSPSILYTGSVDSTTEIFALTILHIDEPDVHRQLPDADRQLSEVHRYPERS